MARQPGPPGAGLTREAVRARADSAFAALQERGRQGMGVDQWTSAHVFEDLPDGGRVELQMNEYDSADVAVIRRHVMDISQMFAHGEFRIPGLVHAQQVPGSRVMASKRNVIRYEAHALPRGGEMRITTRDPEALAAIRAFLAFQRREHRAGHRP